MWLRFASELLKEPRDLPPRGARTSPISSYIVDGRPNIIFQISSHLDLPSLESYHHPPMIVLKLRAIWHAMAVK